MCLRLLCCCFPPLHRSNYIKINSDPSSSFEESATSNLSSIKRISPVGSEKEEQVYRVQAIARDLQDSSSTTNCSPSTSACSSMMNSQASSDSENILHKEGKQIEARYSKHRADSKTNSRETQKTQQILEGLSASYPLKFSEPQSPFSLSPRSYPPSNSRPRWRSSSQKQSSSLLRPLQKKILDQKTSTPSSLPKNVQMTPFQKDIFKRYQIAIEKEVSTQYCSNLYKGKYEGKEVLIKYDYNIKTRLSIAEYAILKDLKLLNHSEQHISFPLLCKISTQFQEGITVFPFCGYPLDTLDQKQFQSISSIQKMARDLFAALEFLHKRGFCHADIQPGNILYNPKSQTFSLFNFENCGYAKTFYRKIRFHEGNIFQLEYRDPQLIFLDSNYANIDSYKKMDAKAADIWALAVILYEIYMQRSLFDDRVRIDKKDPTLREKIALMGYTIQQHLGPIPETFLENAPLSDEDKQILIEENAALEKRSTQENPLHVLKPPNKATEKEKTLFEDFKDLLEHILIIPPEKRLFLAEIQSHPFLMGHANLSLFG